MLGWLISHAFETDSALHNMKSVLVIHVVSLQDFTNGNGLRLISFAASRNIMLYEYHHASRINDIKTMGGVNIGSLERRVSRYRYEEVTSSRLVQRCLKYTNLKDLRVREKEYDKADAEKDLIYQKKKLQRNTRYSKTKSKPILKCWSLWEIEVEKATLDSHCCVTFSVIQHYINKQFFFQKSCSGQEQ